ncbi:TM2 domain-containing protein [Nocardia sp. NPDC051750]|uniref:TM2 domain-containing protein n=1 Tax=Nocardia sp. NPDC051750 TaxID=3364325 RepID=UPI0037A64F0A
MTDPYQQGGPQYGPPGTGPDLSKAPGAPGYPSQPQAQPYPSQPQPYPGQPQPYPGQPDPQYGAAPGYGQPAPGYGAPMGYDPEAPYGRDMYGVPLSDKQKMVAGLLQIFIGGFGVGRFYLGDTGIAIGQICATIFTCGIAGPIWGLIDGIMILTGKVTDSYGRPLRD